MLHFCGGKSFGEGICQHVASWAVNESYGAFFDDVMNKMEPYVDVLHASMILVIFGKFDG